MTPEVQQYKTLHIGIRSRYLPLLPVEIVIEEKIPGLWNLQGSL